MSLRDDDRALGVGVLIFAAILVTAGLFFIVADPVMDQAKETALDQTDDPNATSTIEERTTIWDNLLAYALFMAGVFIIARSVFESKRGP